MSRVFGEIRQNGYVVRDIGAAIRHWLEVLHVGPWFYFDRVPVEDFRYRGRPSEPELSIALSNSGPLQIELIQQRNDAPSMYRDFLRSSPPGLQHVAYWPEDFEGAQKAIEEGGYRIAQSGRIGDPGRFVYLDTEGHRGTVVEVSETNGPKGELFRHIAKVAADWNGEEPIRQIGRAR